MNLSRREAIALGLAGSATALTAGCGQVARRVASYEKTTPLEPPTQDVTPEVRLLNRAAFGPSADDLAHLAKLGREGWVDEQLLANRDEPGSLQMQLNRLDVYRLGSMELRDLPENEVLRQLQQAALLRATYSRNPLKERMIDFWTNHFNIYGRKGWAAYRKGFDETKVIRQNALGSFPEMLRASAKSPSMLAYLDNRFSRKGVPNENYARELMELHTLGVKGGYSHEDIDQVARCFTGWTIETGLWGKGNFKFDMERHDKGEKTVLGQKIPAGGGIEDGEKVLELLCAHPTTANFIASKLCKYLVGDRAEKWIPRTAETFLKTRGDIAAMVRPMLLSDDLIESGPILKRPYDYMVSSLRASGADSDAAWPLVNHLESMGQPLYQWPMPDGYPDKNSAWTGSMLSRWNFAFNLGSGAIGGTAIDHKALGGDPYDAVRMAATVLNLPTSKVPAAVKKAIAGQEPGHALALCLASPDFQWR